VEERPLRGNLSRRELGGGRSPGEPMRVQSSGIRQCVPRPGYARMVKDQYSFTSEGLERIALAGLAPADVWSALRSQQRLVRHLSDSAAAVLGIAASGQHIVIAVTESTVGDNDWDIVGGRPMDRDEITAFTKITGRKP